MCDLEVAKHKPEPTSMTRRPRLAIRQTLRKLLSRETITEAARQSGAFQRIRKVDPFAFVWTLILGSLTGRVRRISELRRVFERVARITIEESSFYDRFTPALCSMMSRLLERVLQQTLGHGRAARGRLAAFADIMVADSTVVRLHRLLAKAYPATRTNQGGAALKTHVLYAVTGAGKQTVKVTAERRSDRRALRLGPWVTGKLLLVDLGYFDHRLLARIDELGGYFIIRAKKNINPLIVDRHINHRGRAVQVIGEHLQPVLDAIERSVLDVQARFMVRRRRYRQSRHTTDAFFRVVGVRDAARDDYHVYITNIPPDMLTPSDVAQTYALRWEVELLFRELKTYHRLAQLPSTKPHVVEALLKASLLSLAASRALLSQVRQRLREGDRERVPHQRWASLFATYSRDILACVLGPGGDIADLERVLMHEALDPNHRKRSPLLHRVEDGDHLYGARRHHPGHKNSPLRAA